MPSLRHVHGTRGDRDRDFDAHCNDRVRDHNKFIAQHLATRRGKGPDPDEGKDGAERDREAVI